MLTALETRCGYTDCMVGRNPKSLPCTCRLVSLEVGFPMGMGVLGCACVCCWLLKSKKLLIAGQLLHLLHSTLVSLEYMLCGLGGKEHSSCMAGQAVCRLHDGCRAH